jgi:hypothetical protein
MKITRISAQINKSRFLEEKIMMTSNWIWISNSNWKIKKNKKEQNITINLHSNSRRNRNIIKITSHCLLKNTIIVLRNLRRWRFKMIMKQTQNNKRVILNNISNIKIKTYIFSSINIWTKREFFICYQTVGNHSVI